MSSFYRDEERTPGRRAWIIGAFALLLVGGGAGSYIFAKSNCWLPDWMPGACTKIVQISPVSPPGTFTPAPVRSVSLFDKGACKDYGEQIRNREHPAQCFDVFYATSRELIGTNEDMNYGNEFGKGLSFGRTKVLVPYMLPSGNVDQYCKHAKLLGIELSILPPVCNETNGKFEYSQDDYESLTEKEYIDYTSKITEVGGVSDWIGLTKLQSATGPDEKREAEKFASELNNALDTDTQSVLLYIHGFQTPFRSSIMTAARLKASFVFQATQAQEPKLTRNLGVPLVYSWPTIVPPDDVSPGVRLDMYVESQLRAEIAAKGLESLIFELSKDTEVRNLNIVAHSMGNRVLLRVLDKFKKNFVNKNGETITVRIINAAADIGSREFQNVLDTSIADGSSLFTQPNTLDAATIYFSNTDQALYYSAISQAMKIFYKAIVTDSSVELDKRMKRTERELRLLGFSQNDAADAVAYLKKYEQEFRQMFRASGVDADHFFKEDACRVGRGVAAFGCGRFVYDTGRFYSIDASNFNTDLYRHGYFENSPAVLADMGCGLRDIRPTDGKRALKPISFRLGIFGLGKKKTYWIFDPKTMHADDCISTGHKYLIRVRKKDKVIQPIEAVVYFDLMKANLSSEAYALIASIAHRGISEESDIDVVIVKGYTDTSGTEVYNKDLSLRRAMAVRDALVVNGIPKAMIHVEGYGKSSPAIDTGDGIREPENRRATIIIIFQTSSN